METFVARSYRFGEFVLHAGARRLWSGQEEIKLAPKEFQTLLLLVEAEGRALEREFMMRAVWPDTVVGDTSLGRCISILRQHLGRGAIESVPRFGYRFGLPVTVCDDEAVSSPLRSQSGAASGVNQVARPTGTADDNPTEDAGAWWHGTVPRASWLRVAVGVTVIGVGGLAAIKGLAGRRTAVVSARKANGPVRLAVLPFRNVSAKTAETDYLRDGIADELTARLGELDLQNLQVLARSTTRQYADTAKTAGSIASETGARYLLEGSVGFDGREVRLTASLVDGETQGVVWSEIVQRPMQELPSMQEEIANRVATNTVFAGAVRGQRKTKDADVSPEAHDEYLRGRYEMALRRRDSYPRALQHFERAVKLEPGYAKGHAGIAEAYIYMTDSLPLTFCYAKAHDAALTALQLDPTLSDAHRDLGWLQMYERNDPAGSEAEFRRALELNPDDARAHGWYASLLGDQRRFVESLEHARTGYELDPRSARPAANYGYLLVQSGEAERGRQMLEAALKLDPDDEMIWGYLGLAYLRSGKYQDAAAAYDHAASYESFAASYLADAAYARAKGGDPADAQKLLKLLTRKTERREWFPAQAMAMTELALGDKVAVREWLRKGVEDHTTTIYELNHEPFYSEMKDQPGFPDMVAELQQKH